MSGRKYTYVEYEELASLRRESSQLRALRQDLPERIENAVAQTLQGMDRRLIPLEARQRQFGEAINGLSEGIRQVEQGMAKRIEDQAQRTRAALQETAARMEENRRELRQELYETAGRLEQANRETEKRLTGEIHTVEGRLLHLNDETRRLMHEQGERLSNAIADERQERERSVNAVNQRIDDIQQDRERLKGIARERISDAQIISDFITGNYPKREHFKPGEIFRLQGRIESARQAFEQGGSEAALAQANAAYQDLSDLRLDLEHLESEWSIWREQVLQTAGRLLAEAQSNRKLNNVEGTGVIAEVNYWTGGKLTLLEEEIKAALDRVEDQGAPLTINELRSMVEIKLPEMDQRIGDIVAEAHLAVLHSQLRTNIADLAVQALESMGFSVQGGLFEGEDMRKGFVAKARNAAGSVVVVTVVPDGDRDRVTINSFEPGPASPAELLQRSRDIAEVMRKNGLEVAEPAMESEAPSDVNLDLEIVRRRKTSPSEERIQAPRTVKPSPSRT